MGLENNGTRQNKLVMVKQKYINKTNTNYGTNRNLQIHLIWRNARKS